MGTMRQQNDERLARVGVEIRTMTASAKADGNRGLNADEQERFHRMEAMEGRIMNSASTFLTDLRDSIPDPKQVMADVRDENQRLLATKENFRKHEEVFSKYLRVGTVGLDPKEKRLLARQKMADELPGQSVPMMGGGARRIKAAQTLTTTGGGYLIPQGFSDQLEVAMKWTSGILSACGSFETATGNPLEWPTENDTGNTGSRIAINTQLTEVDVTLGQISFASYIYATGPVLLPLALVQDSFFDIDQFLGRALGVRLGRVMNVDLTVGTGSSQPLGIVPAVVASGNVLTGATGETTTVSYNDLSNLIEAVDESYLQMPSCGWMMSQSTRKIIRKLVDSSNRPLWTEGLVSSDGVEQKGRLLGFPVTINNSMATMAANATRLFSAT